MKNFVFQIVKLKIQNSFQIDDFDILKNIRVKRNYGDTGRICLSS